MDSAAVLSVGDELLSGDVVDTNAAWLDAQLGARGWTVVEHRTVGDDVEAIADAVRALAARHARVVVTGGLGPTEDDLTIQAVAKAAGVALEYRPEVYARIRARFEARGRPLRPGHRRQAELPVGARLFDNPLGTAPGFALTLAGSEVFVLPGVPTEMRALFETMQAALTTGPRRAVRRVLKTVGLGETDLEARVAPIRDEAAGVRFGFRSTGLVQEVRLYGDDEAAVDAVAGRVEAELEGHVFGRDDDTLAAAVGRALKAAGATVATAESCTGGMVGAALTDVAGSSAYYRGGLVAYANDVKSSAVGVDVGLIQAHGAVSEPVARALAEGARERLGATYGVSTTGVAGPGGGTPDKPVGLVWLAVAGPADTHAFELRIAGDRDGVRRRTVQHALARLWAQARGATR